MIRTIGFAAASWILAATTLLALPAAASAQTDTTYTWDPTGVDAELSSGNNWVGGINPSLLNGGDFTDSAIFSASTNTSITVAGPPTVLDGNYFHTMTFDATAPAYTFNPDTVDGTFDIEVIGNNLDINALPTRPSVINNSGHVQTFLTRDLALIGSGILNAANGDPVTRLSFNIKSLYWGGGSEVRGDFDTSIDVIASGGGTRILNKSGAGTLILTGIGADGTGRGVISVGNTDTTQVGPFGAVRVSNDNSLGLGGAVNNHYTRLLGDVNSDGRLELTNNITTTEGIRLAGRKDGSASSGGTVPYNNVQTVAISNVSGNNAMTGPFLMLSGGGAYNFGSTSGALTVASNLTWSDAEIPDGDPLLAGTTNYLTFQGAGNGVFSGNLSVAGTVLSVGVVKSGTGTMTLSGAANTGIGNLIVRGGTLAFGDTSGFTFVTTSADTGVAPIVHLDASGAKLDVSAVAGGYTLTQSLQGAGTVAGSLAMGSGTQVQPGSGVTTLSDGFSPSGLASGVGKLTFQNNLDLSAGSQMVWTLGALSTSNPGTDFDQLSVGGNLALGGTSTLSLDFSTLAAGLEPSAGSPNAFWAANHTWKIIDTAANTGSTNFATLVNGGPFAGGGTFSTSVGAVASITGDANNDGVVNIFDINFVSANWGTTGPSGDVNNDNMVNIFDINLISSSWNNMGPIGNLGDILLNYTVPGGATAVPEPSAFVLLVLGVLLSSVRFVRRSRA